jgi:hypothetical protein
LSGRIPILFDRALRPEWIDYALEQFLSLDNEAELRTTLRRFMSALVKGVFTQQKTALQLQRTVGYRSPLPRGELERYYELLAATKPDERNPIRLEILCRTNPFFADNVTTLKRLRASGTDFAELQHLYERLVAMYGDRGMVHRRVRYVLQTLASFGCLTNSKGKWHIEDSLMEWTSTWTLTPGAATLQ